MMMSCIESPGSDRAYSVFNLTLVNNVLLMVHRSRAILEFHGSGFLKFLLGTVVDISRCVSNTSCKIPTVVLGKRPDAFLHMIPRSSCLLIHLLCERSRGDFSGRIWVWKLSITLPAYKNLVMDMNNVATMREVWISKWIRQNQGWV